MPLSRFALALNEQLHTISAENTHRFIGADNCTALRTYPFAAVSLCDSWCYYHPAVAGMCADGNHLALGNGAVHFDLPEFVHVIEDKLENGVTRSGVRPTVFVGAGNAQAVFFGCPLELLIVVHSIVTCILHAMDDVQQVAGFVNHACNHFFQRAGGEVG